MPPGKGPGERPQHPLGLNAGENLVGCSNGSVCMAWATGVLREERRETDEPSDGSSAQVQVAGSVVLTYVGCQSLHCPARPLVVQGDIGPLPTQISASEELQSAGDAELAGYRATDGLIAAGHQALATTVEAIMARQP